MSVYSLVLVLIAKTCLALSTCTIHLLHIVSSLNIKCLPCKVLLILVLVVHKIERLMRGCWVELLRHKLYIRVLHLIMLRMRWLWHIQMILLLLLLVVLMLEGLLHHSWLWSEVLHWRRRRKSTHPLESHWIWLAYRCLSVSDCWRRSVYHNLWVHLLHHLLILLVSVHSHHLLWNHWIFLNWCLLSKDT